MKQHASLNLFSTRNRLITRLNRQFGLNIPYDYEIKSHQRKFNDVGGYSWYFSGKDIHLNKYGSTLTITELLKHSRYELYQDGAFCDILPTNY